jgi:glycerol dehydrogenase-like iron-containing ADH family enzyme
VGGDEVIEALELSATIRPERYTILNKLNLDHEGYEKLATNTEVI